MLPTIVTSRPSRIQTAPRPITTIQWKRDQGSLSNRAGTRVSIVAAWFCPSFTLAPLLIGTGYDPLHSRKEQ